MEEEAEVVRRAIAPNRDERVAAQNMAGMERVQQEAARAIQSISGAFGVPQLEGGTAQSEAQQGHVEGQLAIGPHLAIMDAVDHAVPNSEESGGEVAEPNRKRRGREVQVAGGSTSGDISMGKGVEGRKDERDGI